MFNDTYKYKDCDPYSLKLKQKYEIMRVAGATPEHIAVKMMGKETYQKALSMYKEHIVQFGSPPNHPRFQ